MMRPRAAWARQPTLRRRFCAKRASAINGRSTANARQGVIARFYMTRKRRAVDDRTAPGAQERGRPGDLHQEAEALDPTGVQCEAARIRQDPCPEITEDPIKHTLYKNNPSPARTLQSPEMLFVTSLQKTAHAGLETSVAMSTRKTRRFSRQE